MSKGGGPQPHIHPSAELFTFFGTNFDDPHDLGGEVDLVGPDALGDAAQELRPLLPNDTG